jgi:hypothetical protein
MSPLAIVQKQLAVLAEMAVEGQTEAAVLQAEVADLTNRLSAATLRMTRLETALSNQARMIHAVCASLQESQQIASLPQQALASGAPATQSNGAPEAPVAQPEPPMRTTPTSPALRAAPAPAHQEMTAASAEARSAPAPTVAEREAPMRDVQAPARPVAQPATAASARASEATSTAQAPLRPSAQPAAPARTIETAAEPPVEQSTPRIQQPAPAFVPPQPVPERAPNDNRPRVQRGSTVEVSFEDGNTETYTIVRQNEANPTQNYIGENSPLGSALIGACVGEKRTYRVRVSAPEQTVQVRAIA